MLAITRASGRPRGLLAVILLSVTFAGSAAGQILPWEVTVAEIEAGRIRGLAARLARQNVQYQLHLGDVRKSDLVATVAELDRVLESLQQGNPSYSVPEPWTPELRALVVTVDQYWGPLRKIAVASPFDYFRVARQFQTAEARTGDPLLLRYFDDLTDVLIAQSEKLQGLYDDKCRETGLDVCTTARTSGYATMLIERATRSAVYIVAGIDDKGNRKLLRETVEEFANVRKRNQESSFFAAALAPERSLSAKANAELLASLRDDWDAMAGEFVILTAEKGGHEYDLRNLLAIQTRLVSKVERLTAALIRYASLTYGS